MAFPGWSPSGMAWNRRGRWSGSREGYPDRQVRRGVHPRTGLWDYSGVTAASDLRRSLAGVRGLILDLDGVLVLRNELLPGAVEALAAMDRARLPYVIGTNISMIGRPTLARDLARGGLAVPADRIVTAASAAAAVARRRFGDEPIYVMTSQDALTEFHGLRLLSHDEAAQPGAVAAAVFVGDAADEFTPRNVQSAFRLIHGGAAFVAMHKNRWWITPSGILLDSGAYVAALEYATERRALVTGKPSRAFFAEGVRLLSELASRAGSSDGVATTPATDAATATDVAQATTPATDAAVRGAASLQFDEVAMVGDDMWNDIRGAQKAGLRGVFARSGKHGDAEVVRAAGERGGREPDAIAASIGEVVAALT